MKQRNLKEEYEQAQRELASNRDSLQILQGKRSTLQGQNSSLEQLQNIEDQIKSVTNQYSQILPRFNELQQRLNQEIEEEKGLINIQKDLDNKILTVSKTTNQTKELFLSLDNMLAEFSELNGVSINTETMLIKVTPPKELMQNPELAKKICEEKSIKSFNEVVEKIGDINVVDSSGMTLLMYALKHGFWYGVEKLLSMDADVSIVDSNGCNALMYACSISHFKYVKIIAEKTDNVTVKSKLSNTALHHLLQGAKILYASDFGSKGSEVNYIGEGCALVGEGNNVTLTIGKVTSIETDGNKHAINSVVCGSRPEDGFNIYEQKILNIIKILTDAGADINLINDAGLSPLFLSLKGQNRYLSNKLLETYPVPLEVYKNMTDQSGMKLITYSLGDPKLLKLMLDLGLDVNTTNANQSAPTLLQQALSNSLFDVSKILLESGANVKYLDNNGNSCWHHLVQHHSPNHSDVAKLAKLLLQYNNEINCRDSGATPFYVVCTKGDVQMMIELKNLGADINIPNKAGFHPIYAAIHNGYTAVVAELLKWGINIDCKVGGYTPLQYYCELPNNKVEVVKFLLDSGAKTDHFGTNGMTPFHIAAFKGDLAIVKLLFEKGELNVDLKSLGNNDCTALWLAAQEGKIETVKWLTQQGANLDSARMIDGRSIIHAAVYKGHFEVIKHLIEKGANVNQPNKAGFTPIYAACEKANFDIIKLLIDNGANVNICGESGDYPIGVASNFAGVEVIDLLVKSGAKLDTLNKTGCSIMHEAFYGGNLAVIKYIMAQGLPVNVKCNEGKLPLQYLLETKLVSKEIKANIVKELKLALSEHGIDAIYITKELSNEVFELLGEKKELFFDPFPENDNNDYVPYAGGDSQDDNHQNVHD
jgi:ankyrin repeat protein